jgi:hypothetical protein
MFGGNDCLGPLHEIKECENQPHCPGKLSYEYLYISKMMTILINEGRVLKTTAVK